MNKLILCLLAAAAVTACSKDEMTDTAGSKGYPLTLDAGTSTFELVDENGTRAGYDGTKSIWHSGDAIGLTVNAGNQNLQFTQVAGSLSSDGTKVQYTGNLNSQVSGNVNALAYYPYSASAAASNSVITTTFPATQNYVAGALKGIPLFAGYSGDFAAMKFQFKNAFSVIKLTLSKDASISGAVSLRKIVFQGNNNETVSGAVSVNMSGASPVVSYTGSGKTITLDCGAGVALTTAAQTFYIAVPAINYSAGYTLTFITDKGQQTKRAKTTAGVTYAANTVYKATPLALDKLSVVSVIVDVNLQNALRDLGLINIIDPLTGLVGINASGLAATSIDVSNKGITSLVGIENFPLLTSLNISNNVQLGSADLSGLPLLATLNASNNTLLTSLNLGSNPALLSLDVSNSGLTSLDLHNNILLTTVKVYGNPLVTLNISGLKALLTLNLVSGVNSISELKLTIPSTANIQNIVAEGTLLSTWTSFECINNTYVKTISLKNNTGLLGVTATGSTNLTSLDVSGNATLTAVNAKSNALTTLNLTGDAALATLDASRNQLTNLDLHLFPLLTSVKVYGNQLVSLNLSNLTALNVLYLKDNETDAIASLKLTIPSEATIQNFIFDGVSVASLWTSFDCTENSTIKSISLKNNVKLLSATVAKNANLTSLDLSGNILQTTLRAYGTGTSILTTLNISGMKALTTLYFSSSNTNCIALAGLPPLPTLTIPSTTKIRNIIADGTLLAATWTNFACSNNPTIQTISLKNNLGLLGVNLTNNTSLTSLVITGSGLGISGVTASGNAAGFTIIP